MRLRTAGLRCMGLTHTSGLMGLAHTSSLSCREKSVVGGGGCLECAVAWAARRKAI